MYASRDVSSETVGLGCLREWLIFYIPPNIESNRAFWNEICRKSAFASVKKSKSHYISVNFIHVCDVIGDKLARSAIEANNIIENLNVAIQ